MLRIYRNLLALAKQLPDQLSSDFAYRHLREAFRLNKHITSPTLLREKLREAESVEECLRQIVFNGPKGQECYKWLDDLTWGRCGRLSLVIQQLRRWNKQTACPLLKDYRSRLSKQLFPHPCYAIPFPAHLYPQIGWKTIEFTPLPSRIPRRPPRYRAIPFTDAHGYTFLRWKPLRQPPWLGMMLKKRAKQEVFFNDLRQRLEAYLQMMRLEEGLVKHCHLVPDTQWTRTIAQQLGRWNEEKRKVDQRKKDQLILWDVYNWYLRRWHQLRREGSQRTKDLQLTKGSHEIE